MCYRIYKKFGKYNDLDKLNIEYLYRYVNNYLSSFEYGDALDVQIMYFQVDGYLSGHADIYNHLKEMTELEIILENDSTHCDITLTVKIGEYSFITEINKNGTITTEFTPAFISFDDKDSLGINI